MLLTPTAVVRDEHLNNFGPVRLALALLVLISHCFPLTAGNNDGEPLFSATRTTTLGSVAVNGFFVISGYLIATSWLRSTSTSEFLVKRLLRIYPGYCVAFCFSIAAGVIGSGTNAVQYIKHLYARHDAIVQSLLFLDSGSLDDYNAFSGNPYPRAINGSLWTLQAEVQCYWIVVGLGLTGLLTRRRLTTCLFSVSYAMYASQVLHFMYAGQVSHLGNGELSRWRLWTYFLFGVMMAHRGEAPTRRDLVFAGFALAGLLASLNNPTAFVLALPLLGSYAVLAVSRARGHFCGRLFSRFDLSYGVYLYAFPVQQLVVQYCDARTPLVLAIYSMPITFLLAWMSWVWIEQPAMKSRERLLSPSRRNGMRETCGLA